MSSQPGDLIETVTLEVRVPTDGRSAVEVGKPPPQEPQDVWAYRIAVGAVGAAIFVFLIGAAVIAAVGKSVPSQYWTSGSALSGALLGILAPSPTIAANAEKKKVEGFGNVLLAELKKFGKDVWVNRAVLILLLIFGVAVWRDIEDHSTEWQALAAAAGGG